MIDNIEDVVEPGTENIDEGVDYARFGYWFLLGFGILLIIFCIWVLIILCCMCQKNKCWNWQTCGKCLLVLIGLCLLIFTILCFIVLVGSVSMSGMCGFVGELNKD